MIYGAQVIFELDNREVTFDGFNALTERTFDNPYKFETREKAFEEAVKCFRNLFE